MNPFGSSDDDDEDDVVPVKGTPSKSKVVSYPSDLNPFGEDDDEEDVNGNGKPAANGYNDALNPFGSDDDEDNANDPPAASTPVPKPRTSIQTASSSNHMTPECTPVTIRRIMTSDSSLNSPFRRSVSRSSIDSRSRKMVTKPNVPPPPAPTVCPSTPSPQRVVRKSPAPVPAPRASQQQQQYHQSSMTVSNDVSPISRTGLLSTENSEYVNVAAASDHSHSPHRSTPVISNESSHKPSTPRSLRGTGTTPIKSITTTAGTTNAADGINRTREESNVVVNHRMESTPQTGSSLSPSVRRNSWIASVSLASAESTIDSDDTQDEICTSIDSSLSINNNNDSIGSEINGTASTPESVTPVRKVIKKRPAPAPPQAIRRTVCGSLQQIQFDLNQIGDRLAVIQSRINDLEKVFAKEKESHSCDKQGQDVGQGIRISGPVDQTSLISEYLELTRETCTLARKQEELMYQRTEHKLEQEHADLEFQIREIDLIAPFKRTPQDNERSKELIDRLVDVIDQRNDVVENMTRINKRYVFSVTNP